MKLIRITTRYEKDDPIADTYIAFGRCFQSDNIYNGFYLVINSPFTKVREILDVKTFTDKLCLTRNHLFFQTRYVKKYDSWFFTRWFGPIEA